MAGLKVFLALCCLAATSAVQLERKPFKRLIPADVLRGESIQFILECQTNVWSRVFHKLHFAKKKMQYQYAPLTGVCKPDMKEFFS